MGEREREVTEGCRVRRKKAREEGCLYINVYEFANAIQWNRIIETDLLKKTAACLMFFFTNL